MVGPFLYSTFKSVAELDAQYALHLSVDDFEGYVTGYTRRSQAYRATATADLSRRYGPTLAESYDFFWAGKNSPVVIFIHGGYWHAASKDDFSFIAEGLVKRGISVIVEDYALCPRVSMTEISRQHRALVAHVYQNAEALQIDRSRILVSGHSAGGHGAVEVGRTNWSEYGLPGDVVKAVLGISGIYDLRPLPYTFLAPHLQLTTRETLELSPALESTIWLPRTLLAFGRKEPAEFDRQSTEFADFCTARALEVELLPLDRDHYDILDEMSRPDGHLLAWIAEVI